MINIFKNTHERGLFVMPRKAINQTEKAQPPIVREYNIGDTKYIVTASVKAGASEDAAAKVRRLLRNDINKKADDTVKN
jgi:hypothetical protein